MLHKKLFVATLVILTFHISYANAETKESSDIAATSLTGVGINVTDLSRSEKFYMEVFGLVRVFRFPAEGDLLEVGLARPDQPGMSLILAHFNDDPLPDAKSAYGRLIITTNEARTVAKRATDRGSTARNLGQPNGPVIIFLDDPDGYQIELYQPAP